MTRFSTTERAVMYKKMARSCGGNYTKGNRADRVKALFQHLRDSHNTGSVTTSQAKENKQAMRAVWLTAEELKTRFGSDAASFRSALPQREHPLNVRRRPVAPHRGHHRKQYN